MKSIIYKAKQGSDVVGSMLTYGQPLITFLGRLYVSWAFFASGLTKIGDWETTLFLFEYEYQVPLLNFVFAAYLATIAELIVPILLTLGIAGRFNALVLGIVNVVAVISLEEIAPAALNEHIIWGLILLHVMFWGSGKLSVDHLFGKFIAKFTPQTSAA